MLFYEDLVKIIEEEKIENIEKIEKFNLNGKPHQSFLQSTFRRLFPCKSKNCKYKGNPKMFLSRHRDCETYNNIFFYIF